MKHSKYIVSMLVLGSSLSTGFSADYIKNISVETAAAIKHQGITGGQDYGAVLGLGYKFNKYVDLKARAISYSNDDWRGRISVSKM